MSEPLVDVVIAVHNPQRPIARSVGSVLRGTRAAVRVSVVCHNTAEAGIRGTLEGFVDDARLRFLHLNDGIRSPSGPFNAGLDAATARFTSIMGSDDELEPGAIDSWLNRQRSDRADMIIPRLKYASGRTISSPPVRPGRVRNLNAVRDRLVYRSAPLGLIDRERFGDLRLTPAMRNGGDVAYVTHLWFSDAQISFDRYGPAYVINDDATDRVTLSRKPIRAELEWFFLLLSDPWLGTLDDVQRASLALKLARVHIFGAVYNRRDADAWPDDDRLALREAVVRLGSLAPKYERALSRMDGKLLQAILDADAVPRDLVRLALLRRGRLRPSTMFPKDVKRFFARDAPPRFMVASYLVAHGGRG